MLIEAGRTGLGFSGDGGLGAVYSEVGRRESGMGAAVVALAGSEDFNGLVQFEGG